MVSSNTTCFKHDAQTPPALFQNGDVVFQAHHVGWIVAGGFATVATVASFWLIDKHLQWYTNKREQRYIVRLLFLVPIYALISFASYLFWNHSTPLILVRDAYEAIVLTAFFYLLLNYVSPDVEEQKLVLLKVGLSRDADRVARQKGEALSRWAFPLGFIKWKPSDGLYFLQLMKWGILQYCVVRPITTLAAVILDYNGLYCESSWGPGWGHVYIVVIISLSVSVAMYCLIQLYLSIAKDVKRHRPLLKLFSVKAVVFLTFWQATFLSVLSMFGVVKNTKYMTADDINIGIGALLETFEMMIFAFVHIKAFTYKEYRPKQHSKFVGAAPVRTSRLRSLGHALDFRETFREIWIGCIYLLDKVRGKEPSPDFGVRRAAHYEEAFGRPRLAYAGPEKTPKGSHNLGEKLAAHPALVNQEVQIEVGGERQWLGTGDDYGYGLGYLRRERSEGLAAQIERELGSRGIGLRPSHDEPTPLNVGHRRNRRSWWRTVYDRISQTGHEETDHLAPYTQRRLERTSHPRREEAHQRLLQDHADMPTCGMDFERHASDHRAEADILAPLSVYHNHRRLQYSRNQSRHFSELPNGGSALNDRETHWVASVPMIPSPSNRSDSLLARIFPQSDNTSLRDRETDSAHSFLSSSTRGISSSKRTLNSHSINSTIGILSSDEIAARRDRRLVWPDDAIHPSHAPSDRLSFDVASTDNPPIPPEKDYLVYPHPLESGHRRPIPPRLPSPPFLVMTNTPRNSVTTSPAAHTAANITTDTNTNTRPHRHSDLPLRNTNLWNNASHDT